MDKNQGKDIDKMMNDNIGLVYMQLHRFNRAHDEDALSAAMIGLWKAARTYDDAKGVKFSTYASVCIYNAIACYLRPMTNKNQIKDIVSYDSLVTEDITLLEMLPSHTNSPEEAYMSNERQQLILEAVDEVILTLPTKSAEVIKYWRESDYTARQREIALAVGVSQPTVARALAMFKHRLKLRLEEILC